MDWKNIIKEIQACGMRQTEIADACKCSQSLVSAIGNGTRVNPQHAVGQAILSLHKRELRRRAKKTSMAQSSRTQPAAD